MTVGRQMVVAYMYLVGTFWFTVLVLSAECGVEENLRTESSGEEIFTNIIITTYAEAR